MSENKPKPPVQYSIVYQEFSEEYGIATKDDEVDEISVTAPELALLPNVGDYVDYANSINGDLPPEVRRPVVKGKVRSRFFGLSAHHGWPGFLPHQHCGGADGRRHALADSRVAPRPIFSFVFYR